MALVIGGAVLAFSIMAAVVFRAVDGDSAPAEKDDRIASTGDTQSGEGKPEPPNNPGKRDQTTLSFQYMPADASFIAMIRLGKLWNSNWLKTLKSSPESQGTFEQLETTLTGIGLPPGEIVSLQIGLGQLPQPEMPGMATSAMLAADNVSAVVRSHQKIHPEKILQLIRSLIPSESETTRAVHQGTTYHQISFLTPPIQGKPGDTFRPNARPAPPTAEKTLKTIAAFPADERTIVLCPGDQVEVFIERGDQETVPENFRFVGSSQHGLMASAQHVLLEFAPDDPAQLRSILPLNNVNAVLLGLRCFDDVNWQFRARFADQNSVKDAVGVVTSQVQAARTQVDAWKEKRSLREFAAVWELIGDVLTNAQIGRTGTLVDVTGSLTTSEPKILSQLPPALMSAFTSPGATGIAGVQPSQQQIQSDQADQVQPNSPSNAALASDSDDQSSMSPKTPSQPATTSKETQLKITLNLAYDQPFGVFAPDDQETLYATLHLTGQAAAEATHYGFLELAKCQTDNAESLRQLTSSVSMDDPREQFVEIDRDMMFAGDFNPPKNQIRLHLMLEKPPTGASDLKEFEGELELLASNEQKQVTLQKISQKAGQKLSDPVLKKAGLEIRILKPTNERIRHFSETPERSVSLEIDGQKTALLDFELQDQDGNFIETQTAWSEGLSDEPVYYSLQAEQKLPNATALHLSVAVNQTRLRVPFRFEDVSLPEKGATSTAEAVSGTTELQAAKQEDRMPRESDDSTSIKSETGDALFQPADPRIWMESQPSTNDLVFYSIQSIAFSPDSKLLASAGHGGRIRLWDLQTAQPRTVCTGHEGTVHSVAFSPDGKFLASVGSDQTVRLWNTQTGEQVKLLGQHWNEALAADFSPDGSILATGGRDWTVRLWHIDSGEQLGTLKGHVGWVRDVTFSPDGQWLASAAPRRPNRDDGGEIILWDLDSEVPTTISYGKHNNVEITSRKIGAKLAVDSGAESLAFLPNGRQIVAASGLEEAVRLWDLESAESVQHWESRTGPIAVSRDGSLLALCRDDGTAQLRILDTNELVVQWQPHEGGVNSLKFSPDGTTLATAGAKRGVRVWKVPAE